MIKVKIEGISSFVFCNEDYIAVDGVYSIEDEKFQLITRHLNFGFEVLPEEVIEETTEEAIEEITKEVAKETTQQKEIKKVPYVKVKK